MLKSRVTSLYLEDIIIIIVRTQDGLEREDDLISLLLVYFLRLGRKAMCREPLDPLSFLPGTLPYRSHQDDSLIAV